MLLSIGIKTLTLTQLRCFSVVVETPRAATKLFKVPETRASRALKEAKLKNKGLFQLNNTIRSLPQAGAWDGTYTTANEFRKTIDFYLDTCETIYDVGDIAARHHDKLTREHVAKAWKKYGDLMPYQQRTHGSMYIGLRYLEKLATRYADLFTNSEIAMILFGIGRGGSHTYHREKVWQRRQYDFPMRSPELFKHFTEEMVKENNAGYFDNFDGKSLTYISIAFRQIKLRDENLLKNIVDQFEKRGGIDADMPVLFCNELAKSFVRLNFHDHRVFNMIQEHLLKMDISKADLDQLSRVTYILAVQVRNSPVSTFDYQPLVEKVSVVVQKRTEQNVNDEDKGLVKFSTLSGNIMARLMYALGKKAYRDEYFLSQFRNRLLQETPQMFFPNFTLVQLVNIIWSLARVGYDDQVVINMVVDEFQKRHQPLIYPLDELNEVQMAELVAGMVDLPVKRDLVESLSGVVVYRSEREIGLKEWTPYVFATMAAAFTKVPGLKNDRLAVLMAEELGRRNLVDFSEKDVLTLTEFFTKYDNVREGRESIEKVQQLANVYRGRL